MPSEIRLPWILTTSTVMLPLTATPASHTTSYFNEVVFRYTYEEAVRDGHLVDWDLVKVKSDVRINGVFLKEGETVKHVDTTTGTEHLDTLEDEREFGTTDVERKVTSPDSNRKILLELKKFADEHEKRYGRFPKTLIFAANDLPHTSHADELVHLAVDVFERGELFVRDNPEHIEAIRILIERPAGWSTEALKELSSLESKNGFVKYRPSGSK